MYTLTMLNLFKTISYLLCSYLYLMLYKKNVYESFNLLLRWTATTRVNQWLLRDHLSKRFLNLLSLTLIQVLIFSFFEMCSKTYTAYSSIVLFVCTLHNVHTLTCVYTAQCTYLNVCVHCTMYIPLPVYTLHNVHTFWNQTFYLHYCKHRINAMRCFYKENKWWITHEFLNMQVSY